MPLKILLVFATEVEAGIMKNVTSSMDANRRHGKGYPVIDILITGVGGISTAWAMKKWLCSNHSPDLAINAGIAGSYTGRHKIGDVVIPVSDCFADLGIEKQDKYLSLAEAGMMNPDEYPFSQGVIKSENEYVEKMSASFTFVKGATVNTLSGTRYSIARITEKYYPDIETMEGATFFYICAMEKIPFLALRAISNMVEPGSRSNWDIPLALTQLEDAVKKLLLMLE